MDSAADLGPDDLVARIADLLRSAHPLRIGSAVRRAGELLTCVAPPDRAALLDRAIHLTLTDDEDSRRSHIARNRTPDECCPVDDQSDPVPVSAGG